MIRATLEGRVTSIRNPGAVRPWQYVLEPLCGYLILAERLYLEGQPYAEGWNFGPVDDDIQPVDRVAGELASLWNGMQWEKDGDSHPHETRILKLDCSKARARLRWSPLLSFRQALSWTVHWYMEYARGTDMRDMTEEQIDNYNMLVKAPQ
jgi:CDP-glucose 4,6-dehydratase